MKIISHRGFWKTKTEKNSEAAFHYSFKSGFGTETDLRDLDGEIVISHDMPRLGCMTFEEFLTILSKYDNSLPLALNVKSDGLQEKIKNILLKFKVENYFLFDMSIPDTMGYEKYKIPFYIRSSEFEKPNQQLMTLADGIWLDAFVKHDFELLRNGINEKSICIVSPELHGRDHLDEWYELKSILQQLGDTSKIMLCTDIPLDAERVFIR